MNRITEAISAYFGNMGK
ncbi:hypothetical protein VTP21DRAFT_9355 [Calcarisporiella thermophila]